MAEEKVTYRATSAFTDPIVIINFVSLALLAEPVRAIIPAKWLPLAGAVIALCNIALQLIPGVADRPVRLNVAPGASKPVDIKKLE